MCLGLYNSSKVEGWNHNRLFEAVLRSRVILEQNWLTCFVTHILITKTVEIIFITAGTSCVLLVVL